MVQKIRKPLPPLNSIRAFEAVARLGSITQAAQELNVTPSAVSQQIRILEGHIGYKLLDKQKQVITLLDVGLKAFQDVSHGLDLISRAFRAQQTRERRVAISMLSSLANRWLMPQIPALLANHPQLDLYIDTSARLVDFSRELFDLAIRFGRGKYEQLGSDRLFVERFQAVCSPLVKNQIEESIRHRQIDDINFICDIGMHAGEHVTWIDWMERRGLPPEMPARRMVCTDTNMSIDVAVNGYGLLLGRHVLIRSLLEQGTLVALDEAPFESELAYYLVYPSLAGLSPDARQLRDWILKQGRQFRESYGLSS
ncbi:Transcriptional regulator [Paraburkholderia caribensis MBA4]|uniref:Transcriptional regulator n=1 Tax=Paraburkholderia caribensis MBA4 TaxID=1323664 RepID=A0A0P0RBL3_9BURK|nr:LysR substrate-binding domain-containing protein [Paraburkholderia caribensis]ALL65844.1 Transcriptional regulator [Paraburkholderia caribensis MBA4]